MKFLKSFLFLYLFVGSYASANVCSYPYNNNNQLITQSYNLSDSSPFFIKNELTSFKSGQYDIDVNEYFVNHYGNKLGLTGNSWKTVKLNDFFIVKENSYLEFDFLSNGDEAEINGVGLMLYGSSGFHSDRFFQVYGTQTAYNQDYHNYPGSHWITYRVPLWQYFQNTNNKIIEKLLFAGDDDHQQVNQSVYYKNVRLIENYSEYSLPASFEHASVIIQPTANKKIFHHIYPQIITGPDNNIYPVSGGSIVKKVYSPPNSNIQETVYVKENYYKKLCWDQGINFDTNTLATNSMNNLQIIANTSGAKIPSFSTQPSISATRGADPVVLTQNNTMYFDPDVKINGQPKPRFINESIIYSNQSLPYFFENREAGQNISIKSGFITNGLNCSNSGTGKNTKNTCFDLTNLTSFNINTNKYEADSGLTKVNEDLHTINTPLEFKVVDDLDNKWSEDTLKQQTTELLVNTKHFNNYLKSFNPNSSIQYFTGYKPQSIINSPLVSNAAFDSISKKVYFSPPATMYFGSPMTFSRDIGVVAHEYTHAISSALFNGQLVKGSMQGCGINEGFSDIMGYGSILYATNVYNPGVAVAAFDNNDGPNGIRNAANPLLTNNDSIYTGAPHQTKSCVTTPPNIDVCPGPSTICDFNPIPAGGHKQATIITHLYHLMVTGGFNADSSFRPDPFGVSSDETFSHKAAERIFFNAMVMGHGSSNSSGSDFTFCNLRNNMIQATGIEADKVKINQAWRQVYENLDSDCPLPAGIDLSKPKIKIVNTTNGGTLSDGSNLSFGSLNVGFGRTYTLEVHNEGDYKLRLINPTITTSFSQNGLSNQPLVIEVGDSATFNVKFNATNNNVGFNQGAVTFVTNHPDHELFTINLSGTSVGAQGSPDAYEEDDTYFTASNLEFNGNYQSHNFSDDLVDWVIPSSMVYPNSQDCPQYSCSISFRNVAVNNLCFQEFQYLPADPRANPPRPNYTITPSSQLNCNIQNGHYPISNPVSIPNSGSCHVLHHAGISYKITNSSNILSANQSYEAKTTCVAQN